MNENDERKQGIRYRTLYGPGILDNFGAHLIGRTLSIKLVNNEIVTGRMTGYGMYDIAVLDQRTGQILIIMKSAIITVQGDIPTKSER